jgi:hypothetical protein
LILGWDDFSSLVLLVLKELEGVTSTPAAHLHHNGFSLPLNAACNLFRLQPPLSFGYINFFEKEDQRLLSGSNFGFKASLFRYLKLAIALQSAVLWLFLSQ